MLRQMALSTNLTHNFPFFLGKRLLGGLLLVFFFSLFDFRAERNHIFQILFFNSSCPKSNRG